MVSWLKDAVFYEIYPQSFNDTNGDGIGDIQGIIEKLDYIDSLGANALWINPCFDSPFKDAGYDVRDYKKVAPRYGTNDDLVRLFEEAHKKGIHVLLDLVPGHTSEEHEWFRQSGKAERNEYSDRYIWTDWWIAGMKGHPYIGGECARNGVYMLNFFKCQPALNYGFLHPEEKWQMPVDAPGPMATRDAMVDVCKFWLSKGADGFRVDMADSLVKDDDDDKSGTCEVWQYILGNVRKEYPDAAFVSEWNNPQRAINAAGFDMDFYLDWMGNGYNSLVRDDETEGPDTSYFKKDAGGDINRFLDEYLPRYERTRGHGYISMLTCNHDTPRLAGRLSKDERSLFYAFLMTMPGVPFVYYGDEIGMRYIKDQPTVEGGYTRTGSRTPMQWNRGKNLGFSHAETEKLYIPVESSEDAPTVEAEESDPASMLNTMKSLISLRHKYPDLGADGDFKVICSDPDKPFIYQRGSFIIAVNTTGHQMEYDLKEEKQLLFKLGSPAMEGSILKAGPQSFAVLG
ncbi:MAG: alpha-amylase family glycosyl hydrolase [Lachnospiraceae bacterium]|jgi:alpha-glucosidase|nr:alpha-amylase family glycosyl hydrolase [Lachnospiraceae bacterium]MEE3461432.1 alpha-amylase family glycosyl hydrolase [Lachnospiraceae bacterium]